MTIKIYGGGPNPPVRLDKWQNVVGVGWGDGAGDVRYLSCVAGYSGFYTGIREPTPAPPPKEEWDTLPDLVNPVSTTWLQQFRFEANQTSFNFQTWSKFTVTEDNSDGVEGAWSDVDGFDAQASAMPPAPDAMGWDRLTHYVLLLSGESGVEQSHHAANESDRGFWAAIPNEYAPKSGEESSAPINDPSGFPWVAGATCPILFQSRSDFVDDDLKWWLQTFESGSQDVQYGAEENIFSAPGNRISLRTGPTSWELNFDYVGGNMGQAIIDASGITATYQGATFAPIAVRRAGRFSVRILFEKVSP